MSLGRRDRGTVGLCGVEAGSVSQHTMLDHSKLSGKRNLRLLHPGPLGEFRRPTLQAAALDRFGQNDVRGLVKHRTPLSPILEIRPVTSVCSD